MTQPEDGQAASSSAGSAERDQVPTGIYWHQPIWERARSGYVADLDAADDPPPSLIAWLQRAIRVHASRESGERARGAERHAGDGEPGFKRTLVLDVAVVVAMEEAIVADRRELGRVVSRSQFVREAAAAAADVAEGRLGRSLPAAPARLPNRPVPRSRHQLVDDDNNP